MPILVDGNNLLHTLPSGSRSREALRRLSLELVRREGVRLTVVFDGPPPDGTPERESLGSLTILYTGARAADDVIVARLPAGNRARNWVVVSDDRQLRRRAQERGTEVRSLAQWRDKLLRAPRSERSQHRLSAEEIAEWEAYFSSRD